MIGRAGVVVFALSLTSPLLADETAVTLPGEPAPLAGTLLLPEGGGRVPAVLILAGSGPTDRDGNVPGFHNDALRLVAHGLAACGIASLRADKRGIAFSSAAAPEEDQLRVETYVGDAVGWLGFLHAQPRVASVGLVGHSEGGLIATLAAQRMPVDRLALIAASGRRFGVLLREQLDAIGMAPVLRRRAETTLQSLERGEAVEDPPTGLAMLFRASVQPYMISLLRLDPAAELARVLVPTLVIQGTTDLQVSEADARRLAAARPGIAEAIIPGMNHVLREAPPDRSANIATYEDSNLPLAPGLVSRLCAFFRPG